MKAPRCEQAPSQSRHTWTQVCLHMFEWGRFLLATNTSLLVCLTIFVYLTGVLAPKMQKYLDSAGEGDDEFRADRTAGSIARAMGEIAKKAGDAAKAKETIATVSALLSAPNPELQASAAAGMGSAMQALPTAEVEESLKVCE